MWWGVLVGFMIAYFPSSASHFPIVFSFKEEPEADCFNMIPPSLGIVTLVDAKNITRQLQGKEGREAVSQIACADRIILNKSDLLIGNANEEDKGTYLSLA